MDERALFLGLRLLHIGFGAFWVGAMVMMAWFVIPSARSAGPAGGAVLQRMMGVHRLPTWLSVASGTTLLSGLVMYWRLSRAGGGSWARTPMGVGLSVGAAAAIAAMVVGFSMSLPAGRRIGELGARMQSAGGPPDAALVAQMQALQQRAHTAARIIAGLLLLAAAAMATARYL
jgi:hypothetical protein